MSNLNVEVEKVIKMLQKVEITDADKMWFGILLAVLPATYALSRYLPGMTALLSGSKLYTPAYYKYGSDAIFDNTFLTYGTDYILAWVMGVLCAQILLVSRTPKNSTLRAASAFLLGSFSLSTLVGGICHQFLSTSINWWYWRLLWRVCVGSVALAGGALGVCGNALLDDTSAELPQPPPPHWFWMVYGMFYFVCVWFGLFSMTNPACDIFLTGVSQSFPTFYLGLVMLYRHHMSKAKGEAGDDHQTVVLLVAGLLSNCALLPGYDVLCYVGLSDGVRNACLHTFLLTSWTSQGIALRQLVEKQG